MDGWSMDPNATVWLPYDLELANWTMEPAGYAPCIPTVEYASTEIRFGGQQYCEYDDVAKTHHTSEQEPVADLDKKKTKYDDEDPISVFEKIAEERDEDIKMKRIKMHRYPASVRDLGFHEWYTTPTLVAVGPHYHGREALQEAERMKHVAAYQCIKDSSGSGGDSVERLYGAVDLVADDVRRRYGADVRAGVGYDDFRHMMFFDACFLVQWMLFVTSDRGASVVEMEESLSSFIDTNYDEILHDIMLLENQIPWPVLEAVMGFSPVAMDKLIYYLKNCLQLQQTAEEKTLVSCRYDYESCYGQAPPHLLGLLRFHIVGRSRTRQKRLTKAQQRSSSDSASHLAEIGIKLRASESTELVHMGVADNRIFFGGELVLAPLFLDDARASCLLSMAALELCTTSSFEGADDEDSAVCSYLLLLATLAARDEDVQRLRARRLLRGAGLTDCAVVGFLARLRDLRLGSGYVRTLAQIERYKSERWPWTKVYAFYYRNKTTFATIGSFLVGVATVVGTVVAVVQAVGNKQCPDKPCC